MAESRIPLEILEWWNCGASAEEERSRKGLCGLELASAPNPAPCQQLSMEGNANHVSLHDSTKAFRKWGEELSNRIRDCLDVKLDP